MTGSGPTVSNRLARRAPAALDSPALGDVRDHPDWRTETIHDDTHHHPPRDDSKGSADVPLGRVANVRHHLMPDVRATPVAASVGHTPSRRPVISVTPLVHARPMTTFPAHDVLIPGEVVDERPCPVCSATVRQIHRPGRARIYCTNACRQRAYRWRRSHGVRHCVERHGPVERMLANGRRHAMRHSDDPVAGLTDRRNRTTTVCGTFAIPSTRMRFTHYDFLPDHPWSCATCVALIGIGPASPATVPPWRPSPLSSST